MPLAGSAKLFPLHLPAFSSNPDVWKLVTISCRNQDWQEELAEVVDHPGKVGVRGVDFESLVKVPPLRSLSGVRREFFTQCQGRSMG